MRRAIAPLALGALAIVAALALALVWHARFMPVYLSVWLLWGGLPIGALALVLLRAAYGAPAEPGLRAMAIGMPIAALAFIPVLIWMGSLYPWVAGHGPSAPWGKLWLGQGAFIARAVIYWLIFCALAWAFALRWRERGRALALAAAFAFAILATLASFDWIQSIDPTMHSSEFGLLILAFAACSACALGLLISAAAGAPEARRFGFWLGAASAVWIYLQFMQFLVMWSADLPSEVRWYLERDAGPGRVFEWFGFAAGFVLPVLLLLPVRVPRAGLAGIGALALAAHACEAIWLVVPGDQWSAASGAVEGLLMVGAGLAVFGLLLAGRARERLA